LITAGLLNGIFTVGWPVWGPALFLAVGLGAIQAVSLSAGSGWLLRLAGWCAIAMPLESWLRMRYGGGNFLLPKGMWTTVSFGELLSLGTMVAVEFFVVAYGIARDRRGDPAIFSNIRLAPVGDRRNAIPTFPLFRSSNHAQFWFEWRQKGLVLPATFGIFAVFLAAGYLLNRFENGEYEWLHGCFGFGTGFAPIALVAGLVIGHVDPARANPECGAFLAARPATNAELSRALLVMEAASLFMTWAFWITAMLGTTLLLFVRQGNIAREIRRLR
jgi:hypothetical protein